MLKLSSFFYFEQENVPSSFQVEETLSEHFIRFFFFF